MSEKRGLLMSEKTEILFCLRKEKYRYAREKRNIDMSEKTEISIYLRKQNYSSDAAAES
jgi:hypothetical protein